MEKWDSERDEGSLIPPKYSWMLDDLLNRRIRQQDYEEPWDPVIALSLFFYEDMARSA